MLLKWTKKDLVRPAFVCDRRRGSVALFNRGARRASGPATWGSDGSGQLVERCRDFQIRGGVRIGEHGSPNAEFVVAARRRFPGGCVPARFGKGPLAKRDRDRPRWARKRDAKRPTPVNGRSASGLVAIRVNQAAWGYRNRPPPYERAERCSSMSHVITISLGQMPPASGGPR
jgi:hypothetical protein